MGLRQAPGGRPMTDTVWLGAVTLAVLGYLLYALLVPEKF
jgi:K+-transporting ATPase KdpF subunit